MSLYRALRLGLLGAALAITACSIAGRREPSGAAAKRDSGSSSLPGSAPATPVPPPPANLAAIPDAVPRAEPRSRNGNPAYYDVFGRRYYVMASSLGYIERGVASWYGPGFHAERTSTGESYDMYAMTAAHKTLILPTYVRVTNLRNNHSVVVRVNDRGPFVANRIIDLSYAAAAKLDMLRDGTAFVEVRAIDPYANPITTVTPLTSTLLTAQGAPRTSLPRVEAVPPPTGSGSPPAAATGLNAGVAAAVAPAVIRTNLFIQAGAFEDPANARKFAARLRDGNYGTVFVREVQASGRKLFRVRIGPVPDVAAFDQTVKALELAGVHDAQLALD